MNGVRAVLLALLVCTAPLLGAAISVGDESETGADTVAASTNATQTQEDRNMTVVNATGTAEYLAPAHENVDRSGQSAASLDVAGSVAADAGEIRASVTDLSISHSYESADNDTQRRAVIRNGTERLSERVDEIEAREEQAFRRYNEGSRSEAELFRILATVNREAKVTLSMAEWLEDEAHTMGMRTQVDLAATERIRLLRLQGQVRERIDGALEGGEPARVHVDTSGSGHVLAAMDSSSTRPIYVREAYDPTARTFDTADQLHTTLDAEERITEIYPWVKENEQSIRDFRPLGPADVRVYPLQITHPHGILDTYLDGGSTDVFREEQVLDPELVPSTTIETVSDDLRLQINRTYAGGPLGISVVDTETDTRVDARVEINGEHVGSTDSGRLWTVAPRGEVLINASYAGDSVTLEQAFE